MNEPGPAAVYCRYGICKGRDILKKPWPSSRRIRTDIQFHRQAPLSLSIEEMCRVLSVSRNGLEGSRRAAENRNIRYWVT